MSEKEKLDVWAVVELMGHLRLAGRLTEEERFGATMGRVDIPQADGTFATQYFGGSSVYRISPVSEEVARAVASRIAYAPVSAWELPKQLTVAPSEHRAMDCDPTQEEEDRDDRDDYEFDYRDK